MPGQTNELVQNMSQMFGMLMQRRQIENAEEQQKVNQLVIFADLASKTKNPETLEGLQKTFESFGLDTAALSEIRMSVAPNLDVQKAGAAQAGVRAMSPTELGSMQREAASVAMTGQTSFGMKQNEFLGSVLDDPKNTFHQAMRTRLATGMDRGALATSERLAGDPNAQGVALGTIMNAAQTQGDVRQGQGLGLQSRGLDLQSRGLDIQQENSAQQNSLGWAEHRRGWADLTQRGSLGETGHQLERARIVAETNKDQGAMALFKDIDAAVKQGNEAQGQMSSTGRDILVASINAKIQKLNQMGYNIPFSTSETFKSGADTGPFGWTRIK